MTAPRRVLLDTDPYCPSCGHNRDKSSVSTLDIGHGMRQCQMCGAIWVESVLSVTGATPKESAPQVESLPPATADTLRTEAVMPQYLSTGAVLVGDQGFPTVRAYAERLREKCDYWYAQYQELGTILAAAIRALPIPAEAKGEPVAGPKHYAGMKHVIQCSPPYCSRQLNGVSRCERGKECWAPDAAPICGRCGRLACTENDGHVCVITTKDGRWDRRDASPQPGAGKDGEDAERYRWLRIAQDGMIPQDQGDWWGNLGDKLAEDFDSAIDAARAGKPEQERTR